jgi:hypothetical protein
LDSNSNNWRKGPDLPVVISGSPIVEHPRGGVLIIGGLSIYYLPHAGSNAAWETLPQQLKTPREWLTAFLIPDNIVNCSN